MALSYQFCQALRTIPEDKSHLKKEDILSKCICSSTTVMCSKCNLRVKLIDRFINANIPVDFWHREMSDFKGDKKLLKLYNTIEEDLKEYLLNGKSYLLTGNHGVGKTYFSCAVLKLACAKNYRALYSTMGDVVNVLINGDRQVRYEARRELMMVSFLVLDEFDSRFMGSDSAAELFGRILESIIRIRFQNNMPTILISNNGDPTKALGDHLGPSMNSLIAGYCRKLYIIGADYREVIKETSRNK